MCRTCTILLAVNSVTPDVIYGGKNKRCLWVANRETESILSYKCYFTEGRELGVRIMVFNVTFNNISVLS